MSELQPLSPGREKRREVPREGSTRFALFNQSSVDINDVGEGGERGSRKGGDLEGPRNRAGSQAQPKSGLRPGLSFSSIGVEFEDDLEEEEEEETGSPPPLSQEGTVRGAARGGERAGEQRPQQARERASNATVQQLSPPSVLGGWSLAELRKAWRRMC